MIRTLGLKILTLECVIGWSYHDKSITNSSFFSCCKSSYIKEQKKGELEGEELEWILKINERERVGVIK